MNHYYFVEVKENSALHRLIIDFLTITDPKQNHYWDCSESNKDDALDYFYSESGAVIDFLQKDLKEVTQK